MYIDLESCRKPSIRSRPCIILDPDFSRLVLEVIKKLCILEKTVMTLKKTQELKFSYT